MDSRRFVRWRVLAVPCIIAVCAVVSVYAGKFINSSTAKVRAEYKDRMSTYRMTDIYSLEELYVAHQKMFLPLAPPGHEAFVQPLSPVVIPFDWKNFPKEFNDHLIGEMKYNVPMYSILVAEDPKTRDIVIYNADGEEIYALPPPKEYNPYWLVDLWFPGILSGRFDKATTEYILAMYDPARIQMTVSLVPTENLYAYLLAETEASSVLIAQAELLAPDGGYFLLDGEGEFAIADYFCATNELHMTWSSDTNSYYRIYACHDLMAQTWTLTNMLLGNTSQTAWSRPSPTGTPDYCFYRISQLAVTNAGDADADGMDDVWELYYNLNPIIADGDADADTDGLSNFQEYISDSSPNVSDSNTNGVPDGWDIYDATIIKGDVNGDGILSSDDLTALEALLLQSSYNVTPVTFSQADLNNDGVLNEIDRKGLQDLLEGRPQLYIFKPQVN